jgi:hypothetical protein
MDLTKSPNRIFVFSVVGAVILLLVLVWFFGPQPEPIHPSAPVDAVLANLLQSGKQEQKEEDKIVEGPVPETWGRDPFALPYWAEEDHGTEKQQEGSARSELDRIGEKPQYNISTILISGSNRLAVINYQVYSEGDKIGGERISEITLDHVVLSDGSEKRELKLPQSQTKVTVNNSREK